MAGENRLPLRGEPIASPPTQFALDFNRVVYGLACARAILEPRQMPLDVVSFGCIPASPRPLPQERTHAMRAVLASAKQHGLPSGSVSEFVDAGTEGRDEEALV
jgi:hypothetical protein